MVELKTILVPTDFGELGEKALAYGKALARLFESSLHVVHVIEGPFGDSVPVEGYVAGLPEFSARLRKSARAQLARLLDQSERSELQAVEATLSGNASREIVRYAKEQDVDLIVMGTHGRGALAHLLLGSVAERVVRNAPCPVLTVRKTEHDFVVAESHETAQAVRA